MKHFVKYASTVAITFLLGCGGKGGGGDAGPPPCDTACQDGVAVLGLRELIKDVYNVTLQAHPVGVQNAMTKCPLGDGTATVTGTATSNADLGTTTVNLTYVFAACSYAPVDPDPTHTFSLTFDGTVTEVGTLASQPSSTTSVIFESPPMDDAGVSLDAGAALRISGTVYAPSIPYATESDGGTSDGGATPCALVLDQNGNDISGTLCGRNVGASL
jgi:hypothetical protein